MTGVQTCALPISGIRRLHVDHAIDAVDLLLDGRRHGLFDSLRGSPGVCRRHTYVRRSEKRVLLDREAPDDHDTKQENQNRDDYGDDWPPYEEVRHISTPFRLPGRFAGVGRSRIDFAPGSHLLHAFDDHPFSRLESFKHDEIFVGLIAYADSSQRGFVVRVDDQHRLCALEFLDGALRDEDRVLSFGDCNAAAIGPPITRTPSSRLFSITRAGEPGHSSDWPRFG